MIIRIPTLAVLLLAVTLVVPAGAAVGQPQRQKVKLTPVAGSKVPPAQLNTVQKRELARQKLTKKLQVRDANTRSKGGPTTLQKPTVRK